MLGSNAPRILSCKVPNRARRSALRAVFAMSQLPSAELSQELNNCIQTIQKMPGHLAVLEQLQKEHLSSGPDARQTA